MPAVQPLALVYKKPRQAISGTAVSPVYNDALLTTWLPLEYSHKWVHHGGCDTAKFKLKTNIEQGWHILRHFLGNRIGIVFDNPFEYEWEGFINTISFTVGSKKFIHTLNEFGNSIMVNYQDRTSTPNSKLNTEARNTDSIAIYGEKQISFDIGNEYYNALSVPDAIRDKKAESVSYPIKTTHQVSGNNVEIEINCQGFYHTLGWDFKKYNIGSAVSWNIGASLQSLLCTGTYTFHYSINSGGGSDNGTGIFYNSEDESLMTANATTCEYTIDGESRLNRIQSFAEAGDGLNEWVWGITTTDKNSGYRQAYYRQASSEVTYKDFPFDPHNIYTPYGKQIPLYKVRPDNVLETVLNNINAGELDLRRTYLKTVTYDSTSPNPLTYTSDYDMSWRGVFGQNKAYRSSDERIAHNTKKQLWY